MYARANLAKATNKQKAKIHILKAEIGYDDDLYRTVMYNRYRTTSSKNLSWVQAKDFIQFMEEKAGKNFEEKYDNLGERPGMATPAQLRKIEAMWKDVSVQKSTKERAKALDKLIMRIVHVGSILWLKRKDVQIILKTLTSMQHNAFMKEAKNR